MKKIVTCVFAIAVLAGIAPAAHTQIIEQRVWTGGVPISVVNATEDRRPMDVSVVGQVRAYRFIIRPEDPPWRESFGGGLVLFTRNEQVAVAAQTCDGIIGRVLEPPAWARDERVAGPAALSPEFVSSGPGEDELKKRVEGVKYFLDRRKVVGRKELKRQIAVWARTARKYGLRATFADCSVRGPAAGTTVGVWPGAGQAYTLFIRGSRARGYYISTNY